MTYSELTHEELLSECCRGNDRGAWEEFVLRYSRLIEGTVAGVLRRAGAYSESAVDDLVQDTYLRLCKNEFQALRNFRFQHENAIFSYLKTIAANIVRDYLSNPAPRVTTTLEPDTATVDGAAEAERRVRDREVDEQLRGCLAEESRERDYRIFSLYFRKGWSARAISERPDCRLTVSGVESLLLKLANCIAGRMKINGKGRRATLYQEGKHATSNE